MSLHLQAVSGSAAVDAIQILSALKQPGTQVGAVLGSAGAAGAIVKTMLASEGPGAFDSHKYGNHHDITICCCFCLGGCT